MLVLRQQLVDAEKELAEVALALASARRDVEVRRHPAPHMHVVQCLARGGTYFELVAAASASPT